MNKIKDYVEELNTIDEHVRIEAKQCTDRIDKSVLESVCSFSNEPGLNGGVILIGLQESHDASCPYKVIGVADADKLQRDLASQCATMFNHPVRPFIESEIINGKTVIMVTVSELDQRYKPLYFEKESLPRGAWRRIGSTDQRCNEEDLSVFSRAASRELKQLEQSGAILMKGLGRNAYYIPSAKLNALYFVKGGTSVPNDGTSVPNDGTSVPNDGTSCGVDAIPIALKERIEKIGLRVPKEVLADIIIELCRVKPFSGEELAGMLGRSEAHIKNRIVPTLIDNGRLKFIYPEMINHPNQKYTAK